MITVVSDIYLGNNEEEIECYMISGGPEDRRPKRGVFQETETTDGWWKVWVRKEPMRYVNKEMEDAVYLLIKELTSQ